MTSSQMPQPPFKPDNITTQWLKLIAITSIHFFIDIFAGLIPAIMPDIQTEFGWELQEVSWVLFILTISCNAGQILTGHMRADKTKPFFLQYGMCFAAAICFLCLLLNIPYAFYIMSILAIVTGTGIAVTHPEALRAIHALDGISSPVSTAIFITGGAFGFASGGFIGSYFVTLFGLKGLLWFLVIPPISAISIYCLKITLAVEPVLKDKTESGNTDDMKKAFDFWPIFFMAIPTATASMLLVYLLPTRLNELGFELTFGGFSTMMFGFGGAVGSLVWAVIARKKGELRCATLVTFLGVPMTVVYLLLIEYRLAVYILFAAGFCSWAAFPLLVSLSRNARGLNIGRRMGIMIGGSWGAAAILEMLLVLAAKPFDVSVNTLLYFAPAYLMISSCLGMLIIIKRTRKGCPLK